MIELPVLVIFPQPQREFAIDSDFALGLGPQSSLRAVTHHARRRHGSKSHLVLDEAEYKYRGARVGRFPAQEPQKTQRERTHAGNASACLSVGLLPLMSRQRATRPDAECRRNQSRDDGSAPWIKRQRVSCRRQLSCRLGGLPEFLRRPSLGAHNTLCGPDCRDRDAAAGNTRCDLHGPNLS